MSKNQKTVDKSDFLPCGDVVHRLFFLIIIVDHDSRGCFVVFILFIIQCVFYFSTLFVYSLFILIDWKIKRRFRQAKIVLKDSSNSSPFLVYSIFKKNHI